MLCASGVLKAPNLYLSLYLKTHRQQYYALLQQVREQGDWESWLEFFLTGVRETSRQAADAASRLLELVGNHRKQLEALGRPAASALRVFQYLQKHPIVTTSGVAKALNLSAPTARKSITHLVEAGVLLETSGMQRYKRYVYDDYLKILSEGTEPLSR